MTTQTPRQTIMPQTLAMPASVKDRQLDAALRSPLSRPRACQPKQAKPQAQADFYTVRPDGTATVISGTSGSVYSLIWGTCDDPGGYCVQDCGCYKGAFGRASLAPDCRHAKNLAALLPGLIQAVEAAKARYRAAGDSPDLLWTSGPGADCSLCGGAMWTVRLFCGPGGYQSLRACVCGETEAA